MTARHAAFAAVLLAIVCLVVGLRNQHERDTGDFAVYELESELVTPDMPIAWPWFVAAGMLAVLALALLRASRRR